MRYWELNPWPLSHVSSPKYFLLNKIPFRKSSLLNCFLKIYSVAQQFQCRVKLCWSKSVSSASTARSTHPHPPPLHPVAGLLRRLRQQAGPLIAFEGTSSQSLSVCVLFWLDGFWFFETRFFCVTLTDVQLTV